MCIGINTTTKAVYFLVLMSVMSVLTGRYANNANFPFTVHQPGQIDLRFKSSLRPLFPAIESKRFVNYYWRYIVVLYYIY